MKKLRHGEHRVKVGLPPELRPTTLDEVREALAEYGRALLYWDDLPGKCTEDEAHAISTHIKKHAPRWLGALVQAVEDQQRALSAAKEELSQLRPQSVASQRLKRWLMDRAEAADVRAEKAEAEVAQLRADVQRLRNQ